MKRIYNKEAFNFQKRVDSYWEASAPKSLISTTPFSDTETYDVAIIGGGFTGQNAALTLARDYNLKVCIFDSGGPGWGASGRSGGLCCMGGDKLGYEGITKKYGLASAKQYVRTQQEAIDQVRAFCQQDKIEIDASGEGEICLAHSAKVASSFVAEKEEMKTHFGIDSEVYDRDELKALGVVTSNNHGGLHTRLGFGLHPLKYSLGLFESCIEAGVDWFAHCEVNSWQKNNDLHLLDCSEGQIRAKKVICATNGYTAENMNPELRGKLLPTMSNIIVTRPIREDEQKAQGWTSNIMSYDSLNLLHYFRLLPDGRFLFGGRGGTNAKNSTLAPMQTLLTKEFKAMFPAWSEIDIEFFWRGFVALSYNLTPHISHFNHDDSVVYAMAYHGSGVAMGSWSGKQAAKLLVGDKHDIPGFIQKPLAKFPLPFLRVFYIKGAYLGYGIQDKFLS